MEPAFVRQVFMDYAKYMDDLDVVKDISFKQALEKPYSSSRTRNALHGLHIINVVGLLVCVLVHAYTRERKIRLKHQAMSEPTAY